MKHTGNYFIAFSWEVNVIALVKHLNVEETSALYDSQQ